MEDFNKLSEFDSFASMLEALPDDKSCREYLESIRWGGTPTCPDCKCKESYRLKVKNEFRGMYKCSECRRRYTVTVGTIFESTHIPLRKWFIAIYIFSAHKKGISSHQLGRDLGITQKSAWFMLGRIRHAFAEKTVISEKTKLKDVVVQMDETYVGGKNKNRHFDKKVPNSQGRSAKDKTPVFGIMETGGRVFPIVVPDTKAKTLSPIIKQMVKEGTIVVTDDWKAYNNLHKKYEHTAIDHSKNEYIRNGLHTNGIENFWSLFKRGIYGIYHHASRRHLHRYCAEFSFRFNSRKIKDSERFDASLNRTDGRLKYRELIAKL